MNVLQHTRNELNLCLDENRPDRSYRDTLLRFGFVGLHWYSSSQHLIELSPILIITVGQVGKTKFRVNLKYHKIIITLQTKIIPQTNTTEGGVRVCGIAVLGHFWCGVAVVFISKYGIAVFRVEAVCGKFKFYAAVVGEKIFVSR